MPLASPQGLVFQAEGRMRWSYLPGSNMDMLSITISVHQGSFQVVQGFLTGILQCIPSPPCQACLKTLPVRSRMDKHLPGKSLQPPAILTISEDRSYHSFVFLHPGCQSGLLPISCSSTNSLLNSTSGRRECCQPDNLSEGGFSMIASIKSTLRISTI